MKSASFKSNQNREESLGQLCVNKTKSNRMAWNGFERGCVEIEPLICIKSAGVSRAGGQTSGLAADHHKFGLMSLAK